MPAAFQSMLLAQCYGLFWVDLRRLQSQMVTGLTLPVAWNDAEAASKVILLTLEMDSPNKHLQEPSIETYNAGPYEDARTKVPLARLTLGLDC